MGDGDDDVDVYGGILRDNESLDSDSDILGGMALAINDEIRVRQNKSQCPSSGISSRNQPC